MNTPRLGLPYILSSQAQKEITHNEALNGLDTLAQISVISMGTATPPGSPTDGDCYIVAASPTGDWTGQAGKVAAYYSGWQFYAPKEGWQAWLQDVDRMVVHSGGNWAAARALVAAGTGSAPAVAPENDTDTGLYFPAANTVSFATGGTHRVTIGTAGQMGIGTDTPSSMLHLSNNLSSSAIRVNSSHASAAAAFLNIASGAYAGDMLSFSCATTGGTGYSFVRCASSGSDVEFKVDGAGNVASDGGSAMSTPADYADAFEWEDGNPLEEDRVGYAVTLGAEGKIRIAAAEDSAESVIGIVSGNPSICGRAGWNRWHGKYLSDAFNRPVEEEADFYVWQEGEETKGAFADALPEGEIPPDAVLEIRTRRVVNNAFDPEETYVPRLARKEWCAVGLVGVLPLRKGQKTHPGWVYLRDINGTVEEWLVR
jgi:hypothetical protein